MHHLNGVKHDNTASNLIVLCADCHRKKPFHEHMHVKHADAQQINHLRREQQIVSGSDWDSAFKHADPAVHGVLDFCKRKTPVAPEIGYEIFDEKGGVVAELELAWPEKKRGLYLAEIPNVRGWKLMSLNEGLDYFR